MNITHIDSVNFYGDIIDVAVDSKNRMYVALTQIAGHLGIKIDDLMERFEDDPRVDIEVYEDTPIVSLRKLNALLMLIPTSMTESEFENDLLRYQVECSDVLYDYWIHGSAINGRETPYDITSKFSDERQVSRTNLTKAIKLYVDETIGEDPDDLLKSELFDRTLEASYMMLGMVALNEREQLSRTEAMYLSWVENVFAATIRKFAKWGERFEDVIPEAKKHVQNHMDETGRAWLELADAMPASAYKN